jgi:hypothetical protein
MNLNLLAPGIQEELLFLPRTVQGRDAITLTDVQSVAMRMDWKLQQEIWDKLGT